METNKIWQRRELTSFLNQKHTYFDTVKDFDEALNDMDILDQIKWIENGSYGAGACFALQNTLNRLTPRMNKEAHVGQTILHAFYGKPFRYWNKLGIETRGLFSAAVNQWVSQEHEFAQTLEI